MDISIASYAFHGLLHRGQMDLFGYLESCRYRFHLDRADIWNGMLASTEEGYLALVRDALDERELVLANLCVDGAHIWEDDPAAREENHRSALAHLRAAEVLGARTVRIDAGCRELQWSDEQFDAIVARYRQYAARAADGGYRVGPENHWGAEKIPANMMRLITAVDHPAFGVLLHVGSWLGEEADSGDALVAPHVMHTHLAWQITEGPLADKMTLLRGAGYRGVWGVEHHTGENEYTEVATQVARVRDVLDRWRIAGI